MTRWPRDWHQGRAGPTKAGRVRFTTFIRLGQCRETKVAIVIALADRLSQTSDRKEKSPGEARILLFTGVRYERLGEPAKRPAAPRASRTKSK